jgi:hypothetical protein
VAKERLHSLDATMAHSSTIMRQAVLKDCMEIQQERVSQSYIQGCSESAK